MLGNAPFLSSAYISVSATILANSPLLPIREICETSVKLLSAFLRLSVALEDYNTTRNGILSNLLLNSIHHVSDPTLPETCTLNTKLSEFLQILYGTLYKDYGFKPDLIHSSISPLKMPYCSETEERKLLLMLIAEMV